MAKRKPARATRQKPLRGAKAAQPRTRARAAAGRARSKAPTRTRKAAAPKGAAGRRATSVRRKPARPAAPKHSTRTAAKRPAAKSPSRPVANKAKAAKAPRPVLQRASTKRRVQKTAAPSPVRAKAPVKALAKAPIAPVAKAPEPTPQAQPIAPARARSVARPTAPTRRAPSLDRARRTVQDDQILDAPSAPVDLDRSPLAIRAGRDEQRQRIARHTETSPELTGGDVDADWESAYSTGDEAPGGDNPTPDQDLVDEIGHAIGLEYDDDEELEGEEKILRRDRDRWELDPASSDDFDDR